MRDRLRARGDSWGEFIEILANLRLDDRERNKGSGAKGKSGTPLRPPAALAPKTGKKERKRTRGKPLA